MFWPWPHTKDAPNRSLPSSATPRTVIYMRFGPFFTFVAMGKNILFIKNCNFRLVDGLQIIMVKESVSNNLRVTDLKCKIYHKYGHLVY